ncbi:MAG: hypothetical protein R6U57_04190 [Anaerolineales bacterium]
MTGKMEMERRKTPSAFFGLRGGEPGYEEVVGRNTAFREGAPGKMIC